MKDNPVARSQSYAVEIEHILCRIFECERYGFGGVVNSDYIRKHPFHALNCGLAYLYPNSSDKKRKQIEDFIENQLFYADMSIDYLLSFTTNSKTEDIMTTEIDYNNGEEALQDIIKKYNEVLS